MKTEEKGERNGREREERQYGGMVRERSRQMKENTELELWEGGKCKVLNHAFILFCAALGPYKEA